MQLEIEKYQAFRSQFSQFLLFLWSKKQDKRKRSHQRHILLSLPIAKYYGIFGYFLKYYPSQVFAFAGMLMRTINISVDI